MHRLSETIAVFALTKASCNDSVRYDLSFVQQPLTPATVTMNYVIVCTRLQERELDPQNKLRSQLYQAQSAGPMNLCCSCFACGQTGSTLMGPLHKYYLLTHWEKRYALPGVPKSPSVKKHDICSDPNSAKPICPSPILAPSLPDQKVLGSHRKYSKSKDIKRIEGNPLRKTNHGLRHDQDIS